MKKLSLRWRLSIAMTALAAIVCLLLTVLINGSASFQLDGFESAFIEVALNEGEMISLDIDLIELYPELAEHIQDSKNAIHMQSICIFLAIFLFTAAATYLVAGKALSSLRNMTNRIENVQANNLSCSLDVPNSGDEVARLAQSFNAMLHRLSQSFESLRQFSARAAHELRTPLAIMQTKLDVLKKEKTPSLQRYEETAQQLHEQTTRLSHLVATLLELTEIQMAHRSDVINLRALTEEVFCDLMALAESKKITLRSAGDDAEITGNDTLMYSAIYNLVENAIKYNREGGEVTVTIREEKSVLFITVSDTGKGIAKECWEEIFSPFFRVDRSRSRQMGGAGLGLALVKEIAEFHGGNAKIMDSTASGTELRITLRRELREK